MNLFIQFPKGMALRIVELAAKDATFTDRLVKNLEMGVKAIVEATVEAYETGKSVNTPIYDSDAPPIIHPAKKSEVH